MKEPALKYKQKGVFTIELALVSLVFTTLLIFAADITLKYAFQAKLDRLSYSLVSLVKERTALYSDPNDAMHKNDLLSDAQGNELFIISLNSLKRTITNFNPNKYFIKIEEKIFTPQQKMSTFGYGGGNECFQKRDLNKLDNLSIMSSLHNKLPLFRVTICYETENWVGTLLGITYKTIQSSSVMVGR